jgi:nicotinamide phosphoribosyltransferase
MEKNIVTGTDSYKLTHHNMYPEGTKFVESYLEARKGAKYDKTTFAGLQGILKKNLVGIVVKPWMVDFAEKLAAAHFGNNALFDRSRWDYIIEKHGGKLPLKIRAVPEGMQVPVDNVLMTVVNTDEKCAWLTNHVETLLTHVWGPSTVASLSRATKELFKYYLNITCDDGENFAGLAFMLHDFGMRGTSSMESAADLGTGHLINFMGTDTVNAIENILENYNGTLENIPAFSVPATEHSIMTAEGKEGEEKVIERLLEKYPTGILSVVSDSYNIYNCTENIYGKKFREKILAREGKFVVRPDSVNESAGETPEIVMVKLLEILWDKFGGTINNNGYKVLNPKVGLIWGDGIDYVGIEKILIAVIKAGFCVSNLVFGMGGGLLQKINRDTQRFAFKCSARMDINGNWVDVYKEPYDKSKASKRGRLKLIKVEGEFKTVRIEEPGEDLLETVFLNGELIKEYTFDEVRANSEK